MPFVVIALLCVLGFPLSAAAQSAPAEWRLEKQESAFAGGTIRETVWSAARPPHGLFDRVAVHRYRGTEPARAVLLYLPGTNMNGIAAVKEESHNLWLFLAARGIEVFTIDYRTRFVPPTTPPTALSSLEAWTMEAFVGDIAAAADLVRRESGREQLFVAGFSRGVSLAYAYVSTDAARVAGLIALDGGFKSHAPKDAYDAAAARQKLAESGMWASDVAGSRGWDWRQALMDSVAANPDGPATDAKFKTKGDELANVLQFAWGPGGLANPVGGVSRPRTLATLLGGYDRYYPAIQDVDGRSIADRADDPRTAIDDAWGELTTPIILFASTGMTPDFLMDGIYSATKSGSPDVTINVMERYGHLDILVAEAAQREVYQPLLDWIVDRAK